MQEKRDILSNRQHKPNKWKAIPVLSQWMKSAREEALICSMFWDERSSSVVQRDIPPTSAVSMAFICPPPPMSAVSGNVLSLSCSCNTSSKYLHHQTNCQDLRWCYRHTYTQGQQLLVTSHANQKIVLLARRVSIQETAPTHNPVIALHSYISSTPQHSDIRTLTLWCLMTAIRVIPHR